MRKYQKEEMSFLDHLETLRWHIIRSAIAIIILAITAFIFSDIIFDGIILAPKAPDFFTNKLLCNLGVLVNIEKLCINSVPLDIVNLKMAGQFSSHISVSLVAGLIVAFPYVFWEFWSFVSPALYSNEKKHTRGAVFFTSFLFILGVLFGYFLITPLSVHFLGSYSISGEVANKIGLGSYISTVTSVSLASGIIFELPILILFLSKAGLVTSRILKVYRRHSIIIILVLSAVITPPDIFSQVLVSLPLAILYEIGIVIAKRVEKKRNYDFADQKPMVH